MWYSNPNDNESHCASRRRGACWTAHYTFFLLVYTDGHRVITVSVQSNFESQFQMIIIDAATAHNKNIRLLHTHTPSIPIKQFVLYTSCIIFYYCNRLCPDNGATRAVYRRRADRPRRRRRETIIILCIECGRTRNNKYL